MHDFVPQTWEWTRSSVGDGVSNREVTEASFRDVTVGMHVCADARPHAETARHAESAR